MTVEQALATLERYRIRAVEVKNTSHAFYEARAEAIRTAHNAGATVPEIAKALDITHVPIYRALRKAPTQ